MITDHFWESYKQEESNWGAADRSTGGGGVSSHCLPLKAANSYFLSGHV